MRQVSQKLLLPSLGFGFLSSIGRSSISPYKSVFFITVWRPQELLFELVISELIIVVKVTRMVKVLSYICWGTLGDGTRMPLELRCLNPNFNQKAPWLSSYLDGFQEVFRQLQFPSSSPDLIVCVSMPLSLQSFIGSTCKCPFRWLSWTLSQ